MLVAVALWEDSMNDTSSLSWHDLQWCLRRAPRRLLEAMKKHGDTMFVAGGFIRSCISNERVNDIDCFTSTKEHAKAIALDLADGEEKRVHETDNAFTIRGYSVSIQFVHRWTFTNPEQCIESFDFTIAKAAFWWKADPLDEKHGGKWGCLCDRDFYADLAAKRLIYTSPVRNEDAGGSLLRVLKFYQRGYRIPLDSMGAVIARLTQALRLEDVAHGDRLNEAKVAKVLTGLLREVDPNIDPTHVAHLPSQPEDDAHETEETQP